MAQDPLSPHIKFTFGVCAMIGIAAFVFGAIRMQQSIVRPFERRTDFTYKNTEELQKEREESLKKADSDNDTITDYDEMFIYKTSAFLSDTDSDGDPDNLEISSGADPNCPKGKTCQQERTSEQSNTAPGAAETAGAQGAVTTQNNAAPQPSEAQIAAAITATFGPLERLTVETAAEKVATMTKAELTAFLTAIGIPTEVIARTDEATLRILVSQTIAELVRTNTTQPTK